MLENQEEKDIEMVKFDVERDITPKDREDINREITFLHKETIITGDPSVLEMYAESAKCHKILFPNEKIPGINLHTYTALEDISLNYLKRGEIGHHLRLATCKKILYPKEWISEEYGKDFYSNDIIWRPLKEHLEYITPEGDSNDTKHRLDFLEFAQNIKIVSPQRFESINLQQMLRVGKSWAENNIRKDLQEYLNDYWDFVNLATIVHILGYPGKMQLDPLEWVEMEEEGQSIKQDNNSGRLDYLEYSAKRNILSAKEIRITEESFDLIF